jgi:hypothetical protein
MPVRSLLVEALTKCPWISALLPTMNLLGQGSATMPATVLELLILGRSTMNRVGQE